MNRKARTTVLTIFAIIGSFVFWTSGVTAETSVDSNGGLIALTLENMERPPVLFDHDKHAAALEEQTCIACHPEGEGDIPSSYEYPPNVKGDSKNDYRAAYHNHCIECHRDKDKVGTKKPPATCGECHVRDQAMPSASSNQYNSPA